MAFQKFILLLAATQGLLVMSTSGAKNGRLSVDHCIPGYVEGIPSNHIYHTKCKPLVMGHRGNPTSFQENTLDGIKSVAQKGGDGFEVDVFMTSDYELVCFHDENAQRLTGVDRNIEEMTGAEVRDLNYKREIEYGSQTKHYDQERPIAFLHEVLQWAKTTELLVYIEMKPPPKQTPAERQAQIPRSVAMGSIVALLVQSFQMQNQVIINSFDLIKSTRSKSVVTDIVIGNSWISSFWNLPEAVYAGQKQELQAIFPDLAACIDSIPTTGNAFVDFFFRTGTAEKAMHGSFVDIELIMFGNKLYGGCKNTLKMIKRNYGPETVIGVYTLFDLSKRRRQIKNEIPKYIKLVKRGVDLLHTDDIKRAKKLVMRRSRIRRCPAQK